MSRLGEHFCNQRAIGKRIGQPIGVGKDMPVAAKQDGKIGIHPSGLIGQCAVRGGAISAGDGRAKAEIADHNVQPGKDQAGAALKHFLCNSFTETQLLKCTYFLILEQVKH